MQLTYQLISFIVLFWSSIQVHRCFIKSKRSIQSRGSLKNHWSSPRSYAFEIYYNFLYRYGRNWRLSLPKRIFLILKVWWDNDYSITYWEISFWRLLGEDHRIYFTMPITLFNSKMIILHQYIFGDIEFIFIIWWNSFSDILNPFPLLIKWQNRTFLVLLGNKWSTKQVSIPFYCLAEVAEYPLFRVENGQKRGQSYLKLPRISKSARSAQKTWKYDCRPSLRRK